jgi:ribose transport system substrate-binding protein
VEDRIVTPGFLVTEETVDQYLERIEAEEAPEDEGAEPYNFALVTKSVNNPFWDMMHEGAQEVADANNIELTYLAPTKPYNLEEQTRLVDDLIERGVDGIALVPVDSAGIVPAIERANEAGIPVALANTNATGGEVVTFSAIENYDAMTLVAEFMMERLGEEGKVIILEGTPGSQTAIDRKRALDDVTAKYPDVEVLASQTAEFQRAKGLQVMENLLQTYPEIDAVLSCNDEMALGAIEALDAAGRLEDTLVSGFDANDDALKAVYEGRMVVTADQQPGKQAGDALLALKDHLEGESVEDRIVTPGFLVTEETVDQYLERIEE